MNNSHFQRGSGVFKCQSCGRGTRETGAQGGLQYCVNCYELAGIYNVYQDGGVEELRYYAEEIRARTAQITQLGGALDADFVELLNLVNNSETPMQTKSLTEMTNRELVDFYNSHMAVKVKKFADRETALRRCGAVQDKLNKSSAPAPAAPAPVAKPAKVERTPPPVRDRKPAPKAEAAPEGQPRESMKTSLKLDRRITCLETGEVWKNAYRMWLENLEWMTSAQQDRLTSVLYTAAKAGQQEKLKINNRTFQLVSV